MNRRAVGTATPRRSGAWWASGIALAAALGVGWLLGGDDVPPPEDAVLETTGLATLPEITTVAVEPATPAPAEPPAPAVVARGDEEVELCGVGWIPMPAERPGVPDEQTLPPGLAEARRRIETSMASAGDAFDRAVALWIGPQEDATDAAYLQQRAARAQQLARDAATTSDPRIYGLAFRACHARAAGEGPCALLNAGQWARLDPLNALPWLYAIEAADQHRDTAAADEALYRMSVAPRIAEGAYASVPAVLRHAGDDDASLVASHLMAAAGIGATAALSMPVQALSSRCGPAQAADENRRQVCNAIIGTMRERADTVMLSRLGRALARKLGGDAERLERDRAALDQLVQMQPPQSMGCNDIRRQMRQLARAAEVGEVESLREQAQRTAVVAAAPLR